MRRSRIPLAILAGGVLVAGVLALRPAGGAVPAPEVAHAATAPTEPGALTPYLRFSGSGSVTVRPDRAQITVGTEGRGSSSKQALAGASARMARVTARLKALGVAESDLQTGGSYTYRDDTEGRWQASLSLNVVVRDAARAGKLLAEANAAGADQVSGPAFSISDAHAAYAAALRAAIDDARSKAAAAAGQMGVTLGAIVSIDDSAEGAAVPMYARAADAAAAPERAVPVEIGTQDVAAAVEVVFSYGR